MEDSKPNTDYHKFSIKYLLNPTVESMPSEPPVPSVEIDNTSRKDIGTKPPATRSEMSKSLQKAPGQVYWFSGFPKTPPAGPGASQPSPVSPTADSARHAAWDPMTGARVSGTGLRSSFGSARSPSISAGSQWRIERVFGPDKPFPTHLLAQLDEWHSRSPEESPPSALKVLRSTLDKWFPFKVFNFDGDEYELSAYKVAYKRIGVPAKGTAYTMLVLHSENGFENETEKELRNDVFVGLIQNPPSVRNVKQNWRATFLVIWLGLKSNFSFEHQVCAAKVSKINADDESGIKFRAGMFGHSGTITNSSRVCSRLTGSSQPSSPRVTPEKALVQGASSQKDGLLSFESPASPYHGVALGSPMEMASAARLTLPETPPDPYEATHDSHIPVNLSKSGNLGCGPSTKQRETKVDLGSIRFKLLSSNSNKARHFPANGCNVESFFKKAQDFFGNMQTEEAGLWCKIPGAGEERYLGKGCQEEFEMLCRDVATLSLRE
ncbi:hypothetical protein N7470_005174 [Penicillium chermesinum]|nr:hypothetical protein N7470_005174 [Penicillium chermesinum]